MQIIILFLALLVLTNTFSLASARFFKGTVQFAYQQKMLC